MKQLPLELIIQIINQTIPTTPLFSRALLSKSNKKDLSSFSLVNRFWRNLAQVELFRYVDLDLHEVRSFTNSIKGTRLGLLVKRIRLSQLVVNSSCSSKNMFTLFKECKNVIEVQLVGIDQFDVNAIAKTLSNLKSLLIRGCTLQRSLSNKFLALENLVLYSDGEDIINLLNFNSNTFPSLKSLYVNEFNPSVTLIKAIKRLNKPLKHLAISESIMPSLTPLVQIENEAQAIVTTSSSTTTIEALSNLQFLTLLPPIYLMISLTPRYLTISLPSISIPTTSYDPTSLSKITSSLKCLQLHPFPISNPQLSDIRLERFSEIIDSCSESSNLQLLLCSHMDHLRSETSSSELELGEFWQGENCWKKQKLNGFERGYTVREIKDDSPESFWSIIEELNSKYEPRVYGERFREDFIKEQVTSERRRTQFWGLREIITRKIFRDHRNKTIYFISAILNKLVQVYFSSLTLYTLYKSYFTTNELSKGIFLDVVQRFDLWLGVISLGCLSLVDRYL